MIKHFTYDGLGRLIRVQSPFPTPEASTGAVRSERFYYDGARRIQEIVTDPLATIGLAEDPEGEANNPGLSEQLKDGVPLDQQLGRRAAVCGMLVGRCDCLVPRQAWRLEAPMGRVQISNRCRRAGTANDKRLHVTCSRSSVPHRSITT